MPQSLNHREVYPLFLKLLENCISDQELQRLDALFAAHPELVERYCEFGMNYAAVQMKLNDEVDAGEAEAPMDGFDSRLWSELVWHEKTAPHIEREPTDPKSDPVPKVVYEKHPRHISKLAVFSALCSAAALLFLVLLVRFAHEKPYTVEVATLVEQMDVSWADPDTTLQSGDRLRTNQMPVGLDRGVVRIRYDDGVEVLVEGPAKFSIERSGMYLEYGRLFSRVSKSGLGFMVETPTARFVDLGTQFGLQADIDGASELHVLKGRVQLFAGPRGQARTGRIVTENRAVRFNARADRILKEIPCKPAQFVCAIPSPFERMAKSLGASMYLHLQTDSINSLRDGMGSVAAKDIEMAPDLTVVPGPSLGPNQKTCAVRVSGSAGGIRVKNARSIPQGGDGAYSIGCWVRFDEIREQILFTGRVDMQQRSRLRSISMLPDGTLRHFSSNLNLTGRSWGVHSPEALTPGRWYFILITREAGDQHIKEMYVDGKRVARSASEAEGLIKQFDAFQFGGNVDQSGGLRGDLAEMLLFPKALTGAEVQRLYEAAGPRP